MGTRKNRLGEAVLTSTHNLCFEQNYEKLSEFLSVNFQFLVVKFSICFRQHCVYAEMVLRRFSVFLFVFVLHVLLHSS